jgi:hypothetical protein
VNEQHYITRNFVINILRKRSFESPRRRWKDNIKMTLRETDYEDRRCMELADDCEL